MYGTGPISSAPFAALPATPDPRHLWLGASWNTRGLGFTDLVVDGLFDVHGLVRQTIEQFATWDSRGLTIDELPLDASWSTSTVGGELVVGAMWATDIPAVQELPVVVGWAVQGVVVYELPHDAEWRTDGAPLHILPSDAAWETFAPFLQTIPAWDLWETLAPVLSLASVDAQWAVETPDIAELPLDAMWRYSMYVGNELLIVYGAQVAAELEIVYPLGANTIKAEVELASPMLTLVKAELEVTSPIRNYDIVAAELELRYAILDGSVIFVVEPPELTVAGVTFILDDVEIAADEGESFWSCTVTLPDPDNQLDLFGEDEPFTITLGGETYSFIRNEPRLSRTGPAQRSASVTGISPGAVYASPRAERVSKTWDEPTLASAILDEVFGGPGVLELRVLDWTVPGGRLAVRAQTPIDIARSLAQATGAVLESEPDGSLYIRYLWPVSVPFLEQAPPDHVFDDTRDVYTLTHRVARSRVENRFRILDSSSVASALLQAEVDSREDGYNGGKTNFAPGDQPALLIFKSAQVEIDSVLSSAGNIAPLAGGAMEVTEQLTFPDTLEANLKYPADSITSFEWLGNDLGDPELVEATKIRVPNAGIGVLKITYSTTFIAKRLSGVPLMLAGESEYDVLVVVDGSTT